MRKITSRKIILGLFALFFIFLVSIINASSFNVESNLLTNVVCPSSTIVIEEVITADESSSFEVITQGTASSFSTALPMAFSLNKGESRSVYIYVTPPSHTLPGKYTVSLLISDGKQTKQVSHEIIVENCNKLALTLEPVKEVCACDSKAYKATLKNNGLYSERYKLEIFGNAADFAKLSTDGIALDPGESKDFIIYFAPKCTLREDEYTFTIKATSLDSRAIATSKGSIKVKNCYSYTLNAEKNFYSICDGETASAKLIIENKGISDNIYDINIKGPGFAFLQKNTLTLKAGESGEVNISLRPKLGEKPGNYTIKVEALSDKGSILAKDSITVEVRECHKVDLIILFDQRKDKICNALTNTYGVELKNIGEKDGDYVLSLKGPEWAKLKNATTVKLNANKTAMFTLEVAPPYGTSSGDYEIEIKAKDRNSEAEAKDSITIQTFTKEECYRPKISAQAEKLEIEKDKTEVAILTIENTGARRANYIIEASGSATRFVSVTPSILSIEPEKAANVYVYIAPTLATPNGSYSITISVRLNDTTILGSKTLDLEVVDKKVKEEINITTEELRELLEEEEKQGFWEKIKNWFKKVFGKKDENEEAKQEIEQFTGAAIKAMNESELKEVEELVGEQKKSGFREFLSKYKWEIVGALAIIAIILILLLLDVFGRKKNNENKNKKQKE